MNEISCYIENSVEEVIDDIVKMIERISVDVQSEGYSTEKVNLNTRDEFLSAMMVYGFLSYHDEIMRCQIKCLKKRSAKTQTLLKI